MSLRERKWGAVSPRRYELSLPQVPVPAPGPGMGEAFRLVESRADNALRVVLLPHQ